MHHAAGKYSVGTKARILSNEHAAKPLHRSVAMQEEERRDNNRNAMNIDARRTTIATSIMMMMMTITTTTTTATATTAIITAATVPIDRGVIPTPFSLLLAALPLLRWVDCALTTAHPAMAKKLKFDPRKMMEKAIEVMLKSVNEPREDKKPSPIVGAVPVKQDGEVKTACRGELRHGDHAEYTLLERKHGKERLDGSILFATLEPCAPGARKHPENGMRRAYSERSHRRSLGSVSKIRIRQWIGRAFATSNNMELRFICSIVIFRNKFAKRTRNLSSTL